jgi:hypothetical protein
MRKELVWRPARRVLEVKILISIYKSSELVKHTTFGLQTCFLHCDPSLLQNISLVLFCVNVLSSHATISKKRKICSDDFKASLLEMKISNIIWH